MHGGVHCTTSRRGFRVSRWVHCCHHLLLGVETRIVRSYVFRAWGFIVIRLYSTFSRSIPLTLVEPSITTGLSHAPSLGVHGSNRLSGFEYP